MCRVKPDGAARPTVKWRHDKYPDALRMKTGAADPGLVERVDALLPQTQCRLCGYPGCRPYAEALAAGRADINQCPPGGDDGARELAALLGVAAKPVDPRFGIAKPPAGAVIDEALCIGCTLCIQACPVDAIVGAAKLMHTVIARDCTGCELCLPPCPVDCISMVETGAQPTRTERRLAADHARRRFELHKTRLQRERRSAAGSAVTAELKVNQQTVQRAIERAKLRLARRVS
jgi:electron transport complex protein RnfB